MGVEDGWMELRSQEEKKKCSNLKYKRVQFVAFEATQHKNISRGKEGTQQGVVTTVQQVL